MSEPHFNVEKARQRLEDFRRRYLHWGKSPESDGRVQHIHLCDIWGTERTCTCGMHCDLRLIDCGLGESQFESKLYADEPTVSFEEQVRGTMYLHTAFGFPLADAPRDPDADTQEWEVVREVFGGAIAERLYQRWRRREADRDKVDRAAKQQLIRLGEYRPRP